MNDPTLSMLSICRKAQKLKMGFDAVEKTLPEAKLLLFTSDVSPKTRERMLFALQRFPVPYLDIPYSSDDLHMAVGKRIAVFTITDKGLAEAVKKRLDSNPIAD